MSRFALATVLLSAPIAVAQPANAPTADELANAPPPGSESGRAGPTDDGDGTFRVIGRDLLYVPKVAANVALAPVRGGIWAFDKYHLDDLYYRIFFNDARTIGLYPTASFENGFGISGVTGGARFVDRDLFGEREHLALQAAVGTAYYRQLYSAGFRTGNRLGDRLALELDAGYERRPRDAFYGIGNADTVQVAMHPIDPRIDSTAIETRYRQERARVSLTGDARLWDDVHVRVAGAASALSFGPSGDGLPIDMVYDPAAIPGYAGVDYSYGELELRWDSRGGVTVFEPHATFATGSLASMFGGIEHRLDGGPDFWRYGFDAQQFFRISKGPRVIVARLHGEAVSGSRDDVPFTELPKLGGSVFLRGYALDRFRDRVAAFGSAEYQWDIAEWASASVFVDAGRVYPAIGDLSLDHLRVGYGFGIEGHSRDAFVVQTSIASSIDGGLFLNVAFNPVFDLDERVRRK